MTNRGHLSGIHHPGNTMAGIFPNTPGTGENIPVSTYTAGITESYPNVNRQRVVESSINSKEKVDYLPINTGVNNSLTDKYLEFRINGTVGTFIDLSSMVLESKISLMNQDGSNLADDLHVGMANGLSNTLFKSISVFINDKLIESNPVFNYTSYLKMLLSINSDNLNNFGKCGSFNDDANNGQVTNVYTNAIFTTASNIEHDLSNTLKSNGVDICFPLITDMSTLDMYLLDGVDLRIRLEMANNNWLLNSAGDVSNVRIKLHKAKLWLDRVIPHFNAMTALNQALTVKPIEYIFQKTLHKTYVVGTNENSILIDQPFGMVVPEKMTMLLVDMDAYSGQPTSNGLYFQHANLSNIHLTVNGSTHYNINTEFPDSYTQAYYETLKSIGLDVNHMITYNSFKSGRAIFVFNFINEPVEETLPIESSASIRLNIKFGTNISKPLIVILLAETTGLLSIDSHRIISCDVRG